MIELSFNLEVLRRTIFIEQHHRIRTDVFRADNKQNRWDCGAIDRDQGYYGVSFLRPGEGEGRAAGARRPATPCARAAARDSYFDP